MLSEALGRGGGREVDRACEEEGGGREADRACEDGFDKECCPQRTHKKERHIRVEDGRRPRWMERCNGHNISVSGHSHARCMSHIVWPGSMSATKGRLWVPLRVEIQIHAAGEQVSANCAPEVPVV